MGKQKNVKEQGLENIKSLDVLEDDMVVKCEIYDVF